VASCSRCTEDTACCSSASGSASCGVLVGRRSPRESAPCRCSVALAPVPASQQQSLNMNVIKREAQSDEQQKRHAVSALPARVR